MLTVDLAHPAVSTSDHILSQHLITSWVDQTAVLHLRKLELSAWQSLAWLSSCQRQHQALNPFRLFYHITAAGSPGSRWQTPAQGNGVREEQWLPGILQRGGEQGPSIKS